MNENMRHCLLVIRDEINIGLFNIHNVDLNLF